MNRKPRVVRLYDRFFGYRQQVSDNSVAGEHGPIQLRVYTPIGKSHPLPILMIHGLVPYGNRDGYLDTVAENLCTMGYMVVLPTMPAETRYEMRASDLAVSEDAIRWTANTTGEKVSVFGASFGGGLAIPAALQPSVSRDVKLIFSLSGYYNLDTIARYYLHDRVDDPSGKPYPEDSPGPLLIASAYLTELVPADEFPALNREFESLKKSQGREMTDRDASVSRLPADQQRELESLETVSTPQVHQLYLQILVRHHDEIAAISPSSVIHRLNVPLYVLHGEHDVVFPEGEIEWMRKDVGRNSLVHIMVTPWIGHAAIDQPATKWEKLRVASFAANILQAVSRRSPVSK